MTNTSGILVFFAFASIIATSIVPVTGAWTYFVGADVSGNVAEDQYDSAQDIVDAVNFCTALPSLSDINRILKYKEICRKIIELVTQSGYIIGGR